MPSAASHTHGPMMPRHLAHALWLAPYRPFFLLAGLWAVLMPAVWLLPAGLGPDPLRWHQHELLFGMGGAAVGGYLLTALPAWTGRPVAPTITRLMVALWFAGRVTFALGAPPPLGPLAGAAYFLALGGWLSWHVAKARVWRKMPLALAPLSLGCLEVFAAGDFEHDAQRMAPLFFALLISLVGGRAIAAFTHRWAARSPSPFPVADPRWLSVGGLMALLMAVVVLVCGFSGLSGALFIMAGMMQLARMLAWRSWHSHRYPALLLLHLAWLWLPIGLTLAGMAQFPPFGLDMATALHAITMGAMGTMMLAIMGRAAMIRAAGRLLVSRRLAAAFCLVYLSALIRLLMGWADAENLDAILRLAALLWMGGWAAFLLDFGWSLKSPVPRPVLSASSRAGS
ncbi:NnrS family protein [Paracoccus sp. (in: a-proteobacteria)]|uniref:NnrS family protein n=1 Tax=Paracoccus sp. TaxID=267 RepID=UPI0028AC6AF0|nr:NnrS family protein [Paracoccus sp. (in: a-proteobacteria)]